MTDPVIPLEAVEAGATALNEAACICRTGRNQYGGWYSPQPTCPRCGDNDTKARVALEAALPHLRPLVEAAPVCDCYPGGFSPETYEGPQHHCPVHGHGNDLPTTECPVCLTDRQGANR